jgi:hypothetical protein
VIEFGVPWCCFITRFHEQEHQAVSLRYTLHRDIKRDGNKTEIDAWVEWIDGDISPIADTYYTGEVAGLTIEQCLEYYTYNPVQGE